jgi:hypothetical protein
MLNRNHSDRRFALAVGSALAVSLLIAVASLVQAASHASAYLT